uniref:Uncharacterized protein n=1 Tax=Salmonella sp. TaxID=599 RepID=A0A482ETI3_SALSP|nr:hypothetical protein NNIBIDOC_00188 [Salmonella sp.]
MYGTTKLSTNRPTPILSGLSLIRKDRVMQCHAY